MEKALKQLVEKLQKSLGDRVVSVVLYGSAAVGDFDSQFSDLNILCVLSEVTPRELEAAEGVLRWWRDQGHPAPLLLSRHEVATSTDCFAIEFHDIVRQHRILFGEDVVANLEVDDSFYRAQVEHELRAKLLRLRQKAPGVFSDPDLLRRLLADSVSTFCVLLRHALLLHGVNPGMRKRDAVNEGARIFGFPPAPFHTLLDLREGKVKPSAVAARELFSEYLAAIGVVVDAVDRLAKPAPRDTGV
jgi:hypothetical protein